MLDPTKGWYSAQELAGLPGMPGTDRRVRARAEKNLWVSRKMLLGKGLEYALTSLPAETQKHILGLVMNQAAESPALPVAKGSPLPADPPRVATYIAETAKDASAGRSSYFACFARHSMNHLRPSSISWATRARAGTSCAED